MINGIKYTVFNFWRSFENQTDVDGNLFPYPKKISSWIYQDKFIEALENVQKTSTNYRMIEKKDCLLCDQKNITDREYKYGNKLWENGLIHYIKIHNIKPHDIFINSIFLLYSNKIEKPLNVNGRLTKIENIIYVKIRKNQLLIMDALLEHGGYTQKYFNKKKEKLYSEHSGILQIENYDLNKIVINAKLEGLDSDEDDDEFFVPDNEIYMPEVEAFRNFKQYKYTYIFHTHPPTPKPGKRDSIIYELPSAGDIFHFIDHFNLGQVIGSLVVTPEGLYNIRSKNVNSKKKLIDDDDFLYKYLRIFSKVQQYALEKYGTDFTNDTFYSVIAQDNKPVQMINKMLNKFNVHVDFFSRKKKHGEWVIPGVYLPVFQKN